MLRALSLESGTAFLQASPPPNTITLQVGPQKLQESCNYLFFNFVKLLLHRKYVLDEILQTTVRYILHRLQIIFQ
jgi:hypothetical protein